MDPAGTTDTLLVASGGGTVLSSTLQGLFTRIEAADGRTVRTVDVAPASAEDFDGLSAFYLVVGWCVGGYICAAILAISAGSRPADMPRAFIRLATLAVYSALGGLGGAVIVGPVLGALPGSVVALWGLGTLVVFAVGAATLALQSVFGIVGIGLAILLIVVAGNPSAGGAFPLPMLPPSGTRSARPCHRARAPGWPVPSRTSRATVSPARSWSCPPGPSPGPRSHS